MLTNILYLCVGILLCFVLWRVVLGFFLVGLGVSYKIVRYTILHYMLICIYVVFAYIMGLYCINGAIYTDMLYTQDSIFIALCCLMGFVLLHILSVLDFYTQKVPNILLAILFICANILYYVTHGVYDLYPFGVLGVVYGVYFMLHLVGRRRYLGEGDVWIIASLAIMLESFFAYQMSFIFEVLCVASLMGILYYYFTLWRFKRLESSGYHIECGNIKSKNCHTEQSEVSSIESKQGLDSKKDFSPTAQNDKKIDFIDYYSSHSEISNNLESSNEVSSIESKQGLDSKKDFSPTAQNDKKIDFIDYYSSHSEISNNLESSNNDKKIDFIDYYSSHSEISNNLENRFY